MVFCIFYSQQVWIHSIIWAKMWTLYKTIRGFFSIEWWMFLGSIFSVNRMRAPGLKIKLNHAQQPLLKKKTSTNVIRSRCLGPIKKFSSPDLMNADCRCIKHLFPITLSFLKKRLFNISSIKPDTTRSIRGMQHAYLPISAAWYKLSFKTIKRIHRHAEFAVLTTILHYIFYSACNNWRKRKRYDMPLLWLTWYMRFIFSWL